MSDAAADTPRLLTVNGLQAYPDVVTWPCGEGGGAIVMSELAGLGATVGAPTAACVAAFFARHPSVPLVGFEALAGLVPSLPGVVAQPLTLLACGEMPPPLASEGAALLGAAEPLDHLAPPLAAEISQARQLFDVWAVRVDERAVAFAYAPLRSACYFDVSVETERGYRQLGLGKIALTALLTAELAKGRTAVWTVLTPEAHGDDALSRSAVGQLAASVGFARLDHGVVVTAVGSGAP